MKSSEISTFLQQRIEANDFPSAVYLVAEKGEILFQDALGYAVREPEQTEATIHTIYDLASLTKPLVTGLIAANLIERGEIDPNDTVGELLPEFHTSSNAEITVQQLLTHTSGLPAWRPFYLFVENSEDVTSEISRTLPSSGAEPVTYSDLNFLTLASIIELRAGDELGAIAFDKIISPLRLTDTQFNPLLRTDRKRIAASENGNKYEKLTCIEQGYFTPPEASAAASAVGPFRNYQIWGEVHDGNAWFMGGAAGHAGLFSTAEEVYKVALQFLPAHSTLLKAETCQLFRTNLTQGLNEDRSLAFQLATTEGSTAGTEMSRESFGHNGFTGTSLWIDPVRERVFILLTNRTHFHSPPFVNINSVRRRFHDLAVNELDKNT